MSNTGKAFEELLNVSCEQYENKGMAVIDKIPNAWVVKRNGPRIVSAVPDPRFKTIDYIGVSHGRPIHFEAKSTLETKRFPLDNIEDHQFEKLKKAYDQGSVAFLLVSFEKLFEVYHVPFPELEKWWKGYKGDGRKSIPYDYFRLNYDQVKSGRGIFLDFLPVVMKGRQSHGVTQESHKGV